MKVRLVCLLISVASAGTGCEIGEKSDFASSPTVFAPSDSDGLLSEAEYLEAGSFIRAQGGSSPLYEGLGRRGIQNLGADFCRLAGLASTLTEAGASYRRSLQADLPGDEPFQYQMGLFATVAAQYMCVDVMLSLS